jgi:hypothetical protein
LVLQNTNETRNLFSELFFSFSKLDSEISFRAKWGFAWGLGEWGKNHGGEEKLSPDKLGYNIVAFRPNKI